MSTEKLRVLFATLAGLAVGCVLINAVQWQPLALNRSPIDMAMQSRFMQPLQSTGSRASIKVSAALGTAGLVPCAESKAFAKLQKKEVKALEKRMPQYEPGSAPALALEATKARTEARFASYAKSGLLCGTDGLPHLIADPGLALKYGHANDVFVPTIGFLLFAGFLGESGRQYILESKKTGTTDKEIIIDVPLALKCLGKACAWPAIVIDEVRRGTLVAPESEITRSPRL